MVSFILKILLLSILVAYLLKLFGAGSRKRGPAAAGDPKPRRFNPEGRIIRDATFTEIKEDRAGEKGPPKTGQSG
jgi:hypothetical protein